MTGLYVHIPFCKAKCRYCDFNSFANLEGHIAPYFSALMTEARAWSDKLCDTKFDTLYFGGGTPSYISPVLLGNTTAELLQSFNFSKDTEITVECNPATIDAKGFEILKKSGVNRLSIGIQSADNEKLKSLGRIHTFEDFEKCYRAARLAGFENISVDLMYGLPDMTMNEWEYSLHKAAGFEPEHISTYALKIEDGTPFSKMNLNLPDDDLCADMYQRSVDILKDYGLFRYEISNFSKIGCESRHNLKYWHRTDYLGIGAGAHSCMDNKRFFNIYSPKQYTASVNTSGFAIEETEDIPLFEQMSEFLFLGLRCTDGISAAEFKNIFGRDIIDIFGRQIEKYRRLGFMIFENDRLSFSDKGFFVSNTILSDFV